MCDHFFFFKERKEEKNQEKGQKSSRRKTNIFPRLREATKRAINHEASSASQAERKRGRVGVGGGVLGRPWSWLANLTGPERWIQFSFAFFLSTELQCGGKTSFSTPSFVLGGGGGGGGVSGSVGRGTRRSPLCGRKRKKGGGRNARPGLQSYVVD